MNKRQLIQEGYLLFSIYQRPKNFYDGLDCDPESIDHERTLQSRNLSSLSLDDVACIGYNPITGILPEGMAYFMPRLVELALDMKAISTHEVEPYLWGFILQIKPGLGWRKFSTFSNEHVSYMCKVLEFIGDTEMDYINDNCFVEEYRSAVDAWCD